MNLSNERDITDKDKHFLVSLPSGDMLIAERVPPKPKQRVVCYNCRVILEFVVGPTLVKCSRC